MNAVSLILLSLASQVQRSEPLQDHLFSISGWYCTGKTCDTTPRRLGEGLRFTSSPHEAGLDIAQRLTQNWTVQFNCAISGNRFKRCRVVDQSASFANGPSIALKLIYAARLAHPDFGEPRAIVDVIYETSGCPSWFCTPTPPPPPPPPRR